jgi:hypothetical protein
VGEMTAQTAGREFADVARRYRRAIDEHADKSPEDFLLALHPLLCELLFRASVLPDLESDGELPRDHWSGWERLFESLRAFLGRLDRNWVVFDAVERDADDPMESSLADDLADIYRDLGAGLDAAPEPPQPIPVMVIWNWRFAFYSHWGHHAIDAVRAIHALIGYHNMNDLEMWTEQQWRSGAGA